MRKYTYIKIAALIICALCGTIKPADAIPALQLYMPDATYYEQNPYFPESGQSWVTTSNPFELQVLGATTPNWVTYINNLKLHIALLENEYLLYQNLASPFITITDNDPNIDLAVTLYAADFFLPEPGTPSGVSYHGIYPTYYASVDLPNLWVKTAGETVYNYNPGESGTDTGDIQYYTVSYNPVFSFIHFDATGTEYGKQIKYTFAPYSHDADAAVPEPASLSLLGLGLLSLVGLAGWKKRKE